MSRCGPSPAWLNRSLSPVHKNGKLATGEEGSGCGHLGLPFSRPSGYLNIALLVNEEVLQLQVPVDKTKRVQVHEGQIDLGHIEVGMGLTGRHS